VFRADFPIGAALVSGIAGIARRLPTGVPVELLGRMAAAIRHRGPDAYGFYIGQRVGLAHVHLGMADAPGAAQPMANEAGHVIITYNGELFNHPELRRELEDKGHVFKTRSETEVLLHGYEEWGVNLLKRLNGQFAFAIYDRNAESVLIARDRFGVRPLFYSQTRDTFCFGSEIKAILATGEVEAALDRRGLDEIFTFTAARAPRTPFAGIASLEPGTYGVLKEGALWLHRYYELDYPESEREPLDAIEQLDEIMLRSVGMRMRADAPIGAYVSGGLDSAITASLAATVSPKTIRSFSVTAEASHAEERTAQRKLTEAIGSEHMAAVVTADMVTRTLPEVVWHAETPLLRTGPARMYCLAKLTRQSGINFVLGGEGGDQVFLGQELFREASVRRFCLRQPTSTSRQRLFERIYPDLMRREPAAGFWRRSFLDAGSPADPLFSHLPRFLLASRVREYYAPEFRSDLDEIDVLGELRGSLPVRYYGWSLLNQAAYLEMTTFFSPYLLSSEGDRMSMAHGVASRLPFLDHHLFEFAAALPVGSRLQGLRDKAILRRWSSRILPPGTKPRRRPPFQLDDMRLFGASAPDWVREHISHDAIRRVGVFSTSQVDALVNGYTSRRDSSFVDGQALVAILSTQLWHHQFIDSQSLPAPLAVGGASVVLTEAAPAFT
jgi:asparagine synthase (glutamine-hydrolysing)